MIVRSVILHLLPLLTISQTVPDCFTQRTNKPVITCKNADLTGLDSRVFQNAGISEGEIQRLSFENCDIDNLKFLESSLLRGAQTLTLSNIPNLRNDHLSSIRRYMSSDLIFLTIESNSGITSIDALAPAGDSSWVKLEEILAPRNGIVDVDPGFFRVFNNVRLINLRENKLRTLDTRQHNSVSSLSSLQLSGNQLTSIPGLSEFKALEVLQLANNKLDDVSPFIDGVLKSVKDLNLDLSGNQITSFNPSAASDQNIGLSTIDLSNNKLGSIANLGDSWAKNVKTLRLNGNDNLNLSMNAFQGLENLQQLEIEMCGLSRISTHFQNLPKLELLSLNGNYLRQISSTAFSGTTQLNDLSIKNNLFEKLDFLTSEQVTLVNLHKLDIGFNQLENLANFVAAPALEKLTMDGGNTQNRFTQLSTCLSFTELPTTLKVVCARNLPTDTVSSCRFSTFLELLQKKGEIIYNNEDCCNRNMCSGRRSEYPTLPSCPIKNKICSITPIIPGGTVRPESGSTEPTCKSGVREPFQDLHDAEKIVIAVGYILAALFMTMVILLFVRRHRSYDKWLDDHNNRSVGQQPVSTLPTPMKKSIETMDALDGRVAYNTSTSPKYGTLQRQQRTNGGKSFDTISMGSMASGGSHYSHGAKSPFLGRKKFKDSSLDLDDGQQSIRYTNPANATSQSPHKSAGSSEGSSTRSGAESPTGLSIYSYASAQPPRPSVSTSPPQERRRHRSGGAIQRLKSTDLLEELMRVDKDLLPSNIQGLLQNQIAEKKEQATRGPLGRNTRAYGSTPYRSKANSHGIVKKRSHSKLPVNRIRRSSGVPPLSMIKRALPELPLHSMGLAHSSAKSGISLASDKSKLSNTSFASRKEGSIFLGDEETDYNESDQLRQERG